MGARPRIRRQAPRLFQALIVAAAAGVLPPAMAETVYVIDRLLVGLHADQSVDSAIVKVLPTGTRLEVLKRERELAQVRAPEGEVGWVDAGYLTPDPPAVLLLEALQQRNRELSEQLAAATAQADQQAPADDPAAQPVAANRADEEVAELQKRLSSERLKVGELQARISELQEAAAERQAAQEATLEQLRQENQVLKRNLEGVVQQNEGSGVGGFAAVRELASRLGSLTGPVPLLIGLGALLLAAFGGGAYFMDWLNRRRHGGFRV